MRLEYLLYPGLFAYTVSRYIIEVRVTLERNHHRPIIIDGMIPSFAAEMKTVALQMAHDVTPIYRHQLRFNQNAIDRLGRFREA